jgi:growth factor-regulated tyrosine kinase substrate
MISSEPPLVDRSRRPAVTGEDDDPELRAAIEASLREASLRESASAPPTFVEEEPSSYQPSYIPQPSYQSNQQPYQSAYAPPQRPAFTLPTYDLDPREADAVLNFNQTVEDAQAQGGLAGSRSHNVNDLFEKASRVRPKLAMSLDDTDRKQRELTVAYI